MNLTRPFLLLLCALCLACGPESVVSLSQTSQTQDRNARKPLTLPTSSRYRPTTHRAKAHSSCLRSKGPCDKAPIRLDLCDRGQAATPLSESLDKLSAWQEARKTVVLTGRLGLDKTCQKKTCPPDKPCCNTCKATAVLIEGNAELPLKGDKPASLSCKGDASQLCCGIDVRDQEVVVQGVLQGGGKKGHTLQVQSICER